jgi:putative endonuclease
MAKHLNTGKKGEAIAAEFLEANGFRILESNWRHRRLEVDLIGMDGDVLVIVEVKTRSTSFFGEPESFVDKKKEELLARAATEYMHKINHDWAIRFDVVSIILKNENDWEIKHIKDAFFPGL